MSDDNSENRPKPVDYEELFPGRFLKAVMFKGKQVTLTITDVDREKLPQDKGPDKDRGILSFKESKGLQLVLNRTNGICMKEMFGRDLKNWIGKRVTFSPEKDRFGRETVDAIRIVGSPDLPESMDVEVRLPRRKPKTRRLEVTGDKKQEPTKTAPDDDERAAIQQEAG